MITAHAGEMTYAATGPGLGKTKTACHYAASTANAFMVTIDPSIDSVTSLLAEILRALGNKQSGSPWKRQMFALVKTAMVGRRSEERRVGKECVGTCRSRGSQCH